jgi:hypothetical protein
MLIQQVQHSLEERASALGRLLTELAIVKVHFVFLGRIAERRRLMGPLVHD